MQEPIPGWDLSSRNGLPDEIRSGLPGPARDEWERHPGIANAQIFFDYHRFLAGLSGSLAGTLDPGTPGPEKSRQVLEGCAVLIDRARHHHHMEDRYYFPEFRQRFPAMRRGLNLLDRDHDEITRLLDRLETIVRSPGAGLQNNQQADGLRDVLASLNSCLPRHFADEEEIIVPALVRLTQ